MSSGKRSHRGSGWNVNEICVLIVAVVFGAMSLLVIFAGMKATGRPGHALMGAFCPLLFTALPLGLLWRSRSKANRRKSMGAVARSHGPPVPGYPDVMISSGQKFPEICICCGGATKRTSRVSYRGNHTEASPYDWSRVHPFLFVFLAWKFTAHLLMTRLWESVEKRWKRRKAEGRGVVFDIPHCKSCATRRPIMQRHLDFHGRKMIVAAHPLFCGKPGG